MLGRAAQPLIEAFACGGIDVAYAEIDEPLRCFFQDLAIQLMIRCIRLHRQSLSGLRSSASRQCASARARYFLAVGREMPSCLPISSMENPANRCSMSVVDI